MRHATMSSGGDKGKDEDAAGEGVDRAAVALGGRAAVALIGSTAVAPLPTDHPLSLMAAGKVRSLATTMPFGKCEGARISRAMFCVWLACFTHAAWNSS
mmetsp:Transcript_7594/g.23674  ORF Transcript_7594/g.23674 Transcript_7594/m.23674 type:complete len:99 (-) Transcript_7594:619-915(-)